AAPSAGAAPESDRRHHGRKAPAIPPASAPVAPSACVSRLHHERAWRAHRPLTADGGIGRSEAWLLPGPTVAAGSGRGLYRSGSATPAAAGGRRVHVPILTEAR